jgi:hypothetical protein
MRHQMLHQRTSIRRLPRCPLSALVICILKILNVYLSKQNIARGKISYDAKHLAWAAATTSYLPTRVFPAKEKT